MLLLHDFWAAQREAGTDRFHWINEQDLLDPADLNAVAALVWDHDDLGEVDAGSP